MESPQNLHINLIARISNDFLEDPKSIKFIIDSLREKETKEYDKILFIKEIILSLQNKLTNLVKFFGQLCKFESYREMIIQMISFLFELSNPLRDEIFAFLKLALKQIPFEKEYFNFAVKKFEETENKVLAFQSIIELIELSYLSSRNFEPFFYFCNENKNSKINLLPFQMNKWPFQYGYSVILWIYLEAESKSENLPIIYRISSKNFGFECFCVGLNIMYRIVSSKYTPPTPEGNGVLLATISAHKLVSILISHDKAQNKQSKVLVSIDGMESKTVVVDIPAAQNEIFTNGILCENLNGLLRTFILFNNPVPFSSLQNLQKEFKNGINTFPQIFSIKEKFKEDTLKRIICFLNPIINKQRETPTFLFNPLSMKEVLNESVGLTGMNGNSYHCSIFDTLPLLFYAVTFSEKYPMLLNKYLLFSLHVTNFILENQGYNKSLKKYWRSIFIMISSVNRKAITKETIIICMNLMDIKDKIIKQELQKMIINSHFLFNNDSILYKEFWEEILKESKKIEKTGMKNFTQFLIDLLIEMFINKSTGNEDMPIIKVINNYIISPSFPTQCLSIIYNTLTYEINELFYETIFDLLIKYFEHFHLLPRKDNNDLKNLFIILYRFLENSSFKILSITIKLLKVLILIIRPYYNELTEKLIDLSKISFNNWIPIESEEIIQLNLKTTKEHLHPSDNIKKPEIILDSFIKGKELFNQIDPKTTKDEKPLQRKLELQDNFNQFIQPPKAPTNQKKKLASLFSKHKESSQSNAPVCHKEIHDEEIKEIFLQPAKTLKSKLSCSRLLKQLSIDTDIINKEMPVGGEEGAMKVLEIRSENNSLEEEIAKLAIECINAMTKKSLKITINEKEEETEEKNEKTLIDSMNMARPSSVRGQKKIAFPSVKKGFSFNPVFQPIPEEPSPMADDFQNKLSHNFSNTIEKKELQNAPSIAIKKKIQKVNDRIINELISFLISCDPDQNSIISKNSIHILILLNLFKYSKNYLQKSLVINKLKSFITYENIVEFVEIKGHLKILKAVSKYASDSNTNIEESKNTILESKEFIMDLFKWSLMKKLNEKLFLDISNNYEVIKSSLNSDPSDNSLITRLFRHIISKCTQMNEFNSSHVLISHFPFYLIFSLQNKISKGADMSMILEKTKIDEIIGSSDYDDLEIYFRNMALYWKKNIIKSKHEPEVNLQILLSIPSQSLNKFTYCHAISTLLILIMNSPKSDKSLWSQYCVDFLSFILSFGNFFKVPSVTNNEELELLFMPAIFIFAVLCRHSISAEENVLNHLREIFLHVAQTSHSNNDNHISSSLINFLLSVGFSEEEIQKIKAI